MVDTVAKWESRSLWSIYIYRPVIKLCCAVAWCLLGWNSCEERETSRYVNIIGLQERTTKYIYKVQRKSVLSLMDNWFYIYVCVCVCVCVYCSEHINQNISVWIQKVTSQYFFAWSYYFFKWSFTGYWQRLVCKSNECPRHCCYCHWWLHRSNTESADHRITERRNILVIGRGGGTSRIL